MTSYEGKNAVITGGSSGIGFEIARLLAEDGARVLITGRSQDTLDDARKRLGDAVITIRSDASALDDIDALAARAKDELGTLDAVFANAGINAFAPVEATSEELYDQLFQVNAKGPYFTVQRLAPLLRRGSGVVMTTSVANVKGIPMISAYGATKAALRSMARSLARELASQGIRVNAVSPGAIDTGVLEKSMPKDAADQTLTDMAASNPMQRVGRPIEVAKAAIFLAFEATYTTGAELAVDGGGSQL